MTGKAKAKLTVSDYMDYATAHGIGRVKNSPYIILKIFWVLAVLGSIVIVAVQLTRLTEKWRRYPISTKIELETQQEMRFPAMTVCNLNPLKYSLIQYDEILMSAVQVAAAKWDISLNEFEENDNYNGTVYNTTGEVDEFNKVVTGYYRVCNHVIAVYSENKLQHYATAYRNHKSAAEKLDLFRFCDSLTDTDMIEYFRIKMGAEDPDLIGNWSHQLSDLLVSCTFNGVPCNFGYFSRYRSYEYGMCNTFGLKNMENETIENSYKVFAPGKDHGLTMILNAEQEEYLPFITDSAGLIVNIHSPDSQPWAREHGIIISPGFNTEIAVKIEEQDRIPGPEKRCDEHNRYENLAECQAECFERLVPARCGCSIYVDDFPDQYEMYYPEEEEEIEEEPSSEEDNGIKACDAKTDTFCILRTKRALGFGKAKCEDCLVPCRQISYTTRVTTTKWPALQYRPVLEKLLETYSSNISYSTSDVSDNMAQVTVYLPSFTKQTLIEEQAYTDENFVSDIGGQLGLWIGFSVLSLCELVELVILIVNSCFTKKVGPDEKLKE